MDADLYVSFVENPQLSRQLPSFQPKADQNIALHASPAARNSDVLISAFPVHSTS